MATRTSLLRLRLVVSAHGAMLVGCSPAFAHTGSGSGGFIGGFAHPVFGPDHVVAMVAVGLWGAFLGPPAIWLLPIVFPLVMAGGGAAGILGLPLPGVEIGIAVSAIMLGLMVALAARLTAIALAVGETPAADVLLAAAVLTGALVALARPLPALACALLAAVTGAALGLDSPPEAISLALGTITLIGTGLGATIALMVVAAAAGYLVRVPEHVWLRTGVRVLGSWMAASALLVLALRLARGQLF
jgi:urease accessory protein